MRRRQWSHYAAPAAFLLAVTIAVLLVRSALDQEEATTTVQTLPTLSRRTVPATTTRPRATTTRKPPAQRFYTVQAGDTFAVISQKTGVSVARIERLNPNVSSTALFIGQKIRIG